jgi:ELWxxDGT repeat protein
MTDVDGTLFFILGRDGGGQELWKSDGTESGTVRVKSIPDASGFSLGHGELDGTLFFNMDTPESGVELWKSDGTEAGTVRVKDICPGTCSASPGRLLTLGGAVYFNAFSPDSGVELWKSDGTEAGTVRVKDICPGACGSFPGYLTAVDGSIFFPANDGTHGVELWRSDGTEAGTTLVADLWPGSSGGLRSSSWPVLSGQGLYFTADDGQSGEELWRLPLPLRLQCPGSVLAEASSPAGASVSYPPATGAPDPDAPLQVRYSHPAQELFPIGTTEVSATTLDEAGNSVGCTFPVTVVPDVTPPQLRCSSGITLRAKGPEGARVPSGIPLATAFDTATMAEVRYEPSLERALPAGVTRVTAIATDAAGNTSRCTFDIHVLEASPPPPAPYVPVGAPAVSGCAAAPSNVQALGWLLALGALVPVLNRVRASRPRASSARPEAAPNSVEEQPTCLGVTAMETVAGSDSDTPSLTR